MFFNRKVSKKTFDETVQHLIDQICNLQVKLGLLVDTHKDLDTEVKRLQNQFDRIVKPILNNPAASMADKKPMRRKPKNEK